MKFAFILGEKAHFPTAFMCRHMGVSSYTLNAHCRVSSSACGE